MKLLEKFQKIKPSIPEDDDYEEEDIVFLPEELETIKEVAELMNSLTNALSRSDFYARRKLSPLLKESDFWSASTFDC